MTTPRPDVVIIGAGVVGAATAWYLSVAGRRVLVVDRGSVAGGTTGAGEGNVLVSDKPPGSELDLALLSSRLWSELDRDVGEFEYLRKGGVVVADDTNALTALTRLAESQTRAGVETVTLTHADLPEHEPHLADDLAGGMLYPQDAQVQPMLAAARLLRAARRNGAEVRTGVDVLGFVRAGDQVTGVRTSSGAIHAGAVVNAAGAWAGELAGLAGVDVPLSPRRGFVLVTEPLPRVIRHKVYAAEYVSDVASDDAALQTSPVIEGTDAGPVLIGSSRERVGYDRTLSVPVLRKLAAQGVRLFPPLERVSIIRAYHGFRPYCPDHLPVIGPDARAPGLFHGCGHEGAGVGLAAATGRLLAQLIGGEHPEIDPKPYAPERFG